MQTMHARVERGAPCSHAWVLEVFHLLDVGHDRGGNLICLMKTLPTFKQNSSKST